MAIDGSGNTTLLLSVDNITAPLLHPTQACQFTSMPPLSDNGFMVRLDATGSVRQSTYLQGNGEAVFEDVAVQQGSLTVATWSNGAAGSSLQILTVAPAPELQLACLGNGASFAGGPLAPGEIVSLFGQAIGPGSAIVGEPDSNGRYPTALGATEVTFDGVAAPLLYVADGQINTIVPFAATSATTVCVTVLLGSTNCIDAAIGAAAPGIFAIPGGPGTTILYAAAVNQDGTINSQQNPAPRGSIMALFATGLGSLTMTPVDGTITGLPLSTQNLTVQVESINPNFQAPGPVISFPVWAGQAPFELAGLSQVNIVVPAYANQIWLSVTQPGASSEVLSQTVQIWVQ
jgi:uncharacterized protein (TIGR03437 family)